MRPGHCVTLIYTSGTTGPPKVRPSLPPSLPQAVMLSHDNLTWVGAMVGYHFTDRRPEDRLVSYLPLSHIAAQVGREGGREGGRGGGCAAICIA